jgi:hypothetical protein
MVDLVTNAPLPDAWPALALPLYGFGLSAVVVMLVVVLLLAVPARPDVTIRVRRLEGRRAA